MPTTLAALLMPWTVLSALGGPVQITDEVDRQIVSAFLQHAEKSRAYCTSERMAQFASQPEDITWQASLHIRMPLVAYQLTGEGKYLDMFVERMDTLCDQLSKGPDGFLGWYGLPLELFRHPHHPQRRVDVILTSFVMAGIMAEFALQVRKDSGLTAAYGQAAERYLELATNHLVRKWDARGNYRDLGDTGAVYVTHGELKPTKAHLTQPHNKHSKICQALVKLYKATGKDDYLVKAIKLGTRLKRCLSLVDNRYVWDYWDPAGAWDVHPEDPSKWKHWIGSEHRSGYYSLSVSFAVFLYEHGLVFTRTDIDRFVATQTRVCWNGSYDNPKWLRVDGRKADPQYSYLAGWLAPFDESIRQMAYGAWGQKARVQGMDHSWQGGPAAMGWIAFKYLTYPHWAGGNPAHTDSVKAFTDNPEGQQILRGLFFEVIGEGYSAPRSPSQMKPMPGA